MSFAQVVSLALLLVMLVLAIWRRINIGLLGLAATFALVQVGGLRAADVLQHFPGGIFTLLVGVSLLFSHLERSGAVRWLVERIYQGMDGRAYLIPWAGFSLGAMISTAGALSTAPITLLVPMVAALSRGAPELFFVNQMAVIIGANAAGLSPLNPAGKVIAHAAGNAEVQYQAWLVWLVGILLGVAVVMVLQFVFRSRGLLSNAVVEPRSATRYGFKLIHPSDAVEQQESSLQPVYALASGVAVLVFVGLVVFAGADVGLTSVLLAVLLMLLFHSPEQTFFRKVPWNAVILLCGLLTYVGAMRDVGTMKAIQVGLLSVTDHMALLLFVVGYLMALMCNIESSMMGIFGLLMPLVFSTFGQSSEVTLVVAAIVAPAVLSVVNPIHVAGTLVVGYTKSADQPAMMRRLFILTAVFALTVPGLLAIVPAMLL